MGTLVKIIHTLIAVAVCFITGCNNNTSSSPYGKILAGEPYVSLTDSIIADPGNAGLYFRRAVLLNKNNYPEPALSDFEKAWLLDKQEPFALGAGTVLMEKNPDAAITFLQKAIASLPQSLLLRLSLAKVFDTQNKTDEALAVYGEILNDDPFQINALLMKADLLDKKQNTSEAIRTLEKAYAVAPQLVELNYNLAFKYAQSSNPKVIQLCDSLIKKDSLKILPEPYYFKGVYYYNTGNKSKALDLFSLAIQRDFNFLDAYIEKARILYEMKEYNKAFSTVQRAASITPTFADAYYWMGKCQEAVGNKDEARLNYQRAYGLDKSLTEAKEAAYKLK